MPSFSCSTNVILRPKVKDLEALHIMLYPDSREIGSLEIVTRYDEPVYPPKSTGGHLLVHFGTAAPARL